MPQSRKRNGVYGEMMEQDFTNLPDYRKLLKHKERCPLWLLLALCMRVFVIIRNYKAPFTNNLGERDLRPEKTKEKVSILFRTWNGIRAHTKIRSFISTLKKRKYDLFSSIARVNGGNPVLR
jgi:hypothetical protein